MPDNTPTEQGQYKVNLVECPGLSADQRAAAELRFRMALEFALGGPEYVLPSLQAYMLAQTLQEDLPLEGASEAEEQVIALWQHAETDAILAAMRPLGDNMDNARFEIVPL
ncbi:hypothetical protein SAMN05216350_101234 [Polaromonas sp. YR568]|uniref:hypothetical protein n=1 Tax=Polaromonas sp. YR568 TaxID=1855301 RepID=UPI0008F32E2A|nr:hypothetical protein [Polaromonas sp. YR568]SFU30782.1 hypothetical protein SAMN05216350_101234 [Polaromonas sp. YR568]